MRIVRRSFFLFAAAVALAAGCASARRDEPITRPLDTRDPQVALGQQVFAANCDQCHPGGAGGEGPPLNNRVIPGAFIHFQVRGGLGAMPPFDEDQVSDKELDALVVYLHSLQSLGGK